MGYVNSAANEITRVIQSFNETQWGIVAVIVVVSGFICMQGFGSRSNY